MSELARSIRVKYGILLAVTTVILVSDLWSKEVVHTTFRWGESRPIFPSFFALTYVRNMGAAFGLLHKAPPGFREPFFIIVPVVALFIIGMVYYRLDPKDRVTSFSLSLIVGGAVGNLIDRLRFGYVIDFLDFHINNTYHWPAFNIADSAIVVGVALMFFQSFKSPNEKISKATHTENPQ